MSLNSNLIFGAQGFLTRNNDESSTNQGFPGPGIEVVGPDVDYNHIREYSGGGVLLALTDAGSKLDESNRKAAQAELVRQAMEPTPMKLARDATRRAVERSFAMPLRAVGVDATVEVSFADEANANEHWDVSRSLEEIYANKH